MTSIPGERGARYATLHRLESLSELPRVLQDELDQHVPGETPPQPFTIVAGPVPLPAGPEPETLLAHGVVLLRQSQARLLLTVADASALRLELVEAATVLALGLAFADDAVEHALLDVPPALAHLVMPLVRLGFVVAAGSLPDPERAAALIMRQSAYDKLHLRGIQDAPC